MKAGDWLIVVFQGPSKLDPLVGQLIQCAGWRGRLRGRPHPFPVRVVSRGHEEPDWGLKAGWVRVATPEELAQHGLASLPGGQL